MSVFQIPKSQGTVPANRFPFKFPGSTKQYSLPLLKFIKPALAVEFDLMSEREIVNAIFDEYYPGEALFAKFEDGEQFEAWSTAYREASGIDVGESEASSDS